MTPEQEKHIRTEREIYDKQGTESGIAHAFPAVAAMSGREDESSGAYNTHMVTKGGDFIQDMAAMIVEQKFDTVFRQAEAIDNQRAVNVAHKNAKQSRKLSDALLEEFRLEDLDQGADS